MVRKTDAPVASGYGASFLSSRAPEAQIDERKWWVLAFIEFLRLWIVDMENVSYQDERMPRRSPMEAVDPSPPHVRHKTTKKPATPAPRAPAR